MLTYTLKTGEIAKVKRDGKIIGNIVNEYLDYSALGTRTYSVIVINSNDCFSESDNAGDLSQSIHLNMQRGAGQPLNSQSIKYDTSQNYYSGRSFPCIDFSEHKETAVTLKFAFSKTADFEKLSVLCDRRETLLYRDRMGERFWSLNNQPCKWQ